MHIGLSDDPDLWPAEAIARPDFITHWVQGPSVPELAELDVLREAAARRPS